jgi:hypothetical protein
MSGGIILHKVGDKIYMPSDRAFLEAIIKLYPKYKDNAIENYMKLLEKQKKFR